MNFLIHKIKETKFCFLIGNIKIFDPKCTQHMCKVFYKNPEAPYNIEISTITQI